MSLRCSTCVELLRGWAAASFEVGLHITIPVVIRKGVGLVIVNWALRCVTSWPVPVKPIVPVVSVWGAVLQGQVMKASACCNYAADLLRRVVEIPSTGVETPENRKCSKIKTSAKFTWFWKYIIRGTKRKEISLNTVLITPMESPIYNLSKIYTGYIHDKGKEKKRNMPHLQRCFMTPMVRSTRQRVDLCQRLYAFLRIPTGLSYGVIMYGWLVYLKIKRCGSNVSVRGII